MTKSQAEAAVTEALTRFKREFLGRGPKIARTYIVDDLIVVRLTVALSMAETRLSQDPDGVELLKHMRTKLIEGSHLEIKRLVEEAIGVSVQSLHTDISSRTGESVFVFTLMDNLESRFEG